MRFYQVFVIAQFYGCQKPNEICSSDDEEVCYVVAVRIGSKIEL